MRNAKVLDDELDAVVAQGGFDCIELDAGELTYISSAGLRVVMKLLKKHQRLSLINALPDVYNSFEITGFSRLLPIRRAPRLVSIDGCEFIGSGGFGEVYRIDPETIVKVYNKGCTRDFVEREREQAQNAFVMGVPTAISYDLVLVNGRYGLVFELLDADTVANIVDHDPSRVPECAQMLSGLLKELHAIKVPEGTMRDRAAEMREWWEKTLAGLVEPDEAAAVAAYLDSVPRGDSFLHGDFHAKNVMLRGDEPLLIDIGEAAMGHPVYDLAQMVLAYVMLPQSVLAGKRPRSLLGYDPELAAPLWRGQIEDYFGVHDDAGFSRVQAMLMPLAYLSAFYAGSQVAGNDVAAIKPQFDAMFRPLVLPAIAAAPSIDF